MLVIVLLVKGKESSRKSFAPASNVKELAHVVRMVNLDPSTTCTANTLVHLVAVVVGFLSRKQPKYGLIFFEAICLTSLFLFFRDCVLSVMDLVVLEPTENDVIRRTCTLPGIVQHVLVVVLCTKTARNVRPVMAKEVWEARTNPDQKRTVGILMNVLFAMVLAGLPLVGSRPNSGYVRTLQFVSGKCDSQ